MSLTPYLVVSALAFAIGVAIIIIRRNGVAVLMGVELILNAAALNFIAFSKHVAGNLNGQVIAIFVIIIAAAEAAVALAIVLNIFTNFNTINVDEADKLRD